MSFDEAENEREPAQEVYEFLAEPELVNHPADTEVVELETSFLHPSSLVFTVISQVRQNLIPAVLALFGAARGNYTFVAIAAVIFVLSIGSAVFRYLTLRYSIRDGELTVQSGLFFRRLRKVPTSKIQNIDLVQNLLHRLIGVAEVRVETASGTEPEATLRVLSLKQVQHLRDRVKSSAMGSSNVESDDETLAQSQQETPAAAVTEVLKIPSWWLVKAGLASNRGMVLVGFVLGLYYQNLPTEDRDLKNMREQIRGLTDYLPDLGDGWMLWLTLAAAGMLLLFLVRLLGVGWFMLRFFGYRLNQVGDDFKISCGLLTKVSATVPIKRIQFVSIHRPLIMRWFGLASIRIETAGGSAKRAEDATKSVSKRWFIPVVPEKEVQQLMSLIRPGLCWTEGSFEWQSLAERATSRFTRAAIFFSILLMVVGLAASQPWGWVPGLVLSPLIVGYAIKRSRSNKYARIGDGVIYRSGVFTKKTSVTFFEKIQGLNVSQSPFDRRWGMRTLSVDTAAAGPANHRISIRFLDEQFAIGEYQEILRRSAVRASL